MTRNKPVETEVVEGAGASARLVLVLKAGTKSGYSGVTPNGKLWRARIYKPAKKQWDTPWHVCLAEGGGDPARHRAEGDGKRIW